MSAYLYNSEKILVTLLIRVRRPIIATTLNLSHCSISAELKGAFTTNQWPWRLLHCAGYG